MKVRFTSFTAPRHERTRTLESSDPYRTSGMTRRADGWTYYAHDLTDPRGVPYVVVAVHHNVTGRVLAAYEFGWHVTGEQIKEARGWVADSFEDVNVKILTNAEVIAGVRRHYPGGWGAFVAECCTYVQV